MEDYGLVFGGFNPLHWGHLALFETGLEEVKNLDILIGSKDIYVLPYELRENTVQTAIEQLSLQYRLNILPYNGIKEGRLKSLPTEKYSALVLGSDVLNHFPESQKVHKSQDRDFFLRFGKLVALEREGHPITEETRSYVNERWHLKEFSPRSPISAKLIRQRYREDQPIESLMPEYVWSQVQPHAELFRTSSF